MRNSLNVAQKLIQSHLVKGSLAPGEEIALRIDQTLTQDATGTFVMLELEAMGLERARTELSAQYVDHNLVQEDHKNADDHLFLRSACQKFGIWYSRPGNGVSHPVHQERFGKPGKTLLGSDSHTPAAGSIAMLAIGAGGLEVATAIAGEPFFLRMPKIFGVKLTGRLPDWVSAKDVILEMLRRHKVTGGVGKIIEYYGPGLDTLSAMDRHVIANMGAELGATTSVFPSDAEVKRFLASQGREEDWTPLKADEGATYDEHDEIDLSKLEPLIAMPSSPDNVRPVREVAGRPIYQAYVGSSANPGFRDFAMASSIVKGQRVHDRVSFDINPSSRQILENLLNEGYLLPLIHAGARIHQAGCNGCIGMGQAPATHEISLRTVPRNFPGRSGTKEDKVCLVSPETAAASALSGAITDPRTLNMKYPEIHEPEHPILNTQMLVAPLAPEQAREVKLVKGPNIKALPHFDPVPDHVRAPVLLKVGDNVSTDEIMPAGAKVLPFRSNIYGISQFAFYQLDETYPDRALKSRESGGHIIVGGHNYGQGSSREHAAAAPRWLGLQVVIAKSFARIHWQNLTNFGVLPLTFVNESDYDDISQSDVLDLEGLDTKLIEGDELEAKNLTTGRSYELRHALSGRQLEILRMGGLINWLKTKLRNSNMDSVRDEAFIDDA
jgi:aconitate hydratase